MSRSKQNSRATKLKQSAAKSERGLAQTLVRSRGTWHFLAWSFVVSQALGRDGLTYGWHWGSQSETETSTDATTVASNNLSTADDARSSAESTTGLAATEPDQALAKAALKLSDSHSPDWGAVWSDWLASLQKSGAVNGSTLFASSPNIYNAATGHAGGANSGGVGPVAGIPPGIDGPVINFTEFISQGPDFQAGIAAFTDQLGIGGDGQTLTGDLSGIALFQADGALTSTADAVSPVNFWFASPSGAITYNAIHSAGDAVKVQWVTQASGYNDQGGAQLQLSNSFAPSDSRTQTTDFEQKTAGNAATLNTSAPSHNLLWITGDYLEFNTIIQINITFNNDNIDLGYGDTASTLPRLINTGDNLQTNKANILDGSLVSALKANQLIVGGSEQHYSVIQASHIETMDKLDFNFEEFITGNGSYAETQQSFSELLKFADLKVGGDVQSNTSYISTSDISGGVTVTPDEFLKANAAKPIDLVKGNFWELNTIFQLNVALDDTLVSESSGGAGRDGGMIASGGNIQFNDATILRHDNSHDLYVGGKYTQFNLVLQLNILLDDTSITQAARLPDWHMAPINMGGNNGADGGHVNVALPNPIDELSLRGGQTVDALI